MAAIAAAVVAAAGVGLSAYGASQQGKGAKSKQKNVPTMTPQGQALQNTALRLLFDRLGNTPQTFSSFKQTGPEPMLNVNEIPFQERRTLGIGSGLPLSIPRTMSPELFSAMQRLGIIPNQPAIRQVAGPTPTAPSQQLLPSPQEAARMRRGGK